MRESPLADLVPLWRTVRQEDTTALITPALDYVGGLELFGVDHRFAPEGQIEGFGEGLRSFVSSLDDACTLHFLQRVSGDLSDAVCEYEACARGAPEPALREYAAARAAWFRNQRLRRSSLYLFFSNPPAARAPLSRGQLGLRMLFADAKRLAAEEHRRRLKALGALRDRLAGRLGQLGLASRELEPGDLTRLHYGLLNPSRARAGSAPPDLAVRDTLWAPRTVARHGEHLREYTEGEALCFEDLAEDAQGRGHFRQADVLRRVCTLKVLPEAGTDYFAAEALQSLSARSPDGQPRPFGYWLSVTVDVLPQGRHRWLLSAQHGLVDALRNAVPFLQNRTVSREAEDRAKQESIAALFDELHRMSSKLVTLSVSLLLEATSVEELDERTEAARAAFAAAGNSELLLEEVAQVPAFLSMLPGAGPYQLRKKACTSRNAADFLPVFLPWRGTRRASSLLQTPGGDVLRLDLFDKELATAHHGLVIADTGSGKSVALGALTLDALAAGCDAILIDNGSSWQPLTELLGGVHLPVDLKTSLCPFGSYRQLVDETGALDAEAIQDVVSFLEVCVHEPTSKSTGFDKLTCDLVSKAVRRCYQERFRDRPDDRPVISDLREAIAKGAVPDEGGRAPHPDDARIAEDLCRRLSLFVGDGLYAPMLDRPSQLRQFDNGARLLTFDLQHVSKSPTTKAIAMATLIQAVTQRAMSRRRRTLVEVDEGHEHLGQDDVGERFLASCYRKMRKFDVAMWMISQRFGDFRNCKAGDAIIGNSKLRIFLRHDAGHAEVAEYFRLSARAAAAFRSLEMRPGHHSDFLLLYGQRVTTVRLALHPLAYWILTTDADDRRLIERAQAKNPEMDRLEVLKALADRFPHGASRPRANPLKVQGPGSRRLSQEPPA